MSLYVVSDVHSFFTRMNVALKNKGFYDSEDNKLVLCGDAFDRGEEPVEMMNFLTDLLEKGKLIYIRGNHEDLIERMLDEIKGGKIYDIASVWSDHYRNGTWDTALQLTGMSEREAIENEDLFLDRIKATDLFTKLLPATVDYYEYENYIFTHGFIPVIETGYGANRRYNYDPQWRNASKKSWESARWINGMRAACKHGVHEDGKTIVVGHYHTSWGHHNITHKCPESGRSAIFTPFHDKEKGILAIDACTAYSKRVNCIVI